jgi:hypothetical protein
MNAAGRTLGRNSAPLRDRCSGLSGTGVFGYGIVRDLVWRRATHLIWLDHDRPIIMYRVIRRSLVRAVLRTETWAGNRERWRHM